MALIEPVKRWTLNRNAEDSKRLVLMDLKYETGDVIGQGAFGKIFIVRNKEDQQDFVAKHMNMGELPPDQRELAVNECKVLSQLQHPNVIEFVEAYRDDDTMYIVMEYAKHGDLWDRLKMQEKLKKKFTEAQIMRWFVQITSAIHYLHDFDILHRDLKSKNILIAGEDGNDTKLADFGFARELDRADMTSTKCGTPHYMAPEIVANKPYDAKADIWALGCILYEIIELQHAFRAPGGAGAAPKILIQKVMAGQFPPLDEATWGPDLPALTNALLTVDPDERPWTRQVLKSPYVYKNIHNYMDTVMDTDTREFYEEFMETLDEPSDDEED